MFNPAYKETALPTYWWLFNPRGIVIVSEPVKQPRRVRVNICTFQDSTEAR